jgi:hypothetical protein
VLIPDVCEPAATFAFWINAEIAELFGDLASRTIITVLVPDVKSV